MTPAEFIQHEQDKYEIFEWILGLVPPISRGTDLETLPDWLKEQLRMLGIDPSSPKEAIASSRKVDWARDAYGRLLNLLPARLRERLRLSNNLAVASLSDVEFNGRVHQCENGHAIVVSLGGLLLTSYAAELWSMHASPGFGDTLILTDHLVCNWKEPPSYVAIRASGLRSNATTLGSTYPEHIGGELEFLFKTYADLGLVNPPGLIMEHISPMPLFPDRRRPGHPLEAGNHFREWGIRFLLLHECGHILIDRFAEPPSVEEEFSADACAFEMGLKSVPSEASAVACLLGAWLILAIARRIDERGEAGSQNTHPPAAERLERLWSFVRATDLLNSSTRAAALAHLQEAESREKEVVRASSGYRQWQLTRGNSLVEFLWQCTKERRLHDFMGQVPRWILFGAPHKLCSSLAAARVECEQRLSANPGDEEARSALTTLMQIYDAVDESKAPNLYAKLQETYQDHRQSFH